MNQLNKKEKNGVLLDKNNHYVQPYFLVFVCLSLGFGHVARTNKTFEDITWDLREL